MAGRTLTRLAAASLTIVLLAPGGARATMPSRSPAFLESASLLADVPITTCTEHVNLHCVRDEGAGGDSPGLTCELEVLIAMGHSDETSQSVELGLWTDARLVRLMPVSPPASSSPSATALAESGRDPPGVHRLRFDLPPGPFTRMRLTAVLVPPRSFEAGSMIPMQPAGQTRHLWLAPEPEPGFFLVSLDWRLSSLPECQAAVSVDAPAGAEAHSPSDPRGGVQLELHVEEETVLAGWTGARHRRTDH